MIHSFVIVVGCTKKKKEYRCKAEEMYSESTLFNKTVFYIKTNYDTPFVILSAKYGIISQETIISPYDTTITNCDDRFIRQNIRENLSRYNKIIAFCGSGYVNALRKALPTTCIVEPLRGLGIGKRLKFLSEVNQQ